ncbi:hypothetical protein BJ742DRAFT_677959 [Cladochytrium replicatum]|nr:hypothetical protein BJ742DRAFT_677959 [Cladochytrium replicatum]
MPIHKQSSSSAVLSDHPQPPLAQRFKDPLWLLGFSMTYCGEAFGNWVALSYISAAVVTPLGIVSVFVGAVLANIYLGEEMTKRQWRGYMFIFAGVLLILFAAPKGHAQTSTIEGSPPDGVPQVSASPVEGELAVQQLLNTFTSSTSISVFGFIAVALSGLIYLVVVQGRQTLPSYVSIISLLGSVTVNFGKILSTVIRLTATHHARPEPRIPDVIPPPPLPIPLFDNSSGSAVTGPSPSVVEIPVEAPNLAFTVPLLLVILVGAILAQEFFKQMALGRFRISQLIPLIYAGFNCTVVVTSIVLFGELSSVTDFIDFFSLFAIAMSVIFLGVQMVHSEPEPIARERAD